MGWLIVAVVVAIVWLFTTYPAIAWGGVIGLVGLIAWRYDQRRRSVANLAERMLIFDPEGPRKTVEVVGESKAQGSLRQLGGGHTIDGVVNRDHVAVLMPEPSNRFDRNAIQVVIGGRLVGYLGREDAAAYAAVLGRVVDAGRIPAVHATLKGGWLRDTGELASIGVQLHMAQPELLGTEIDAMLAGVGG